MKYVFVREKHFRYRYLNMKKNRVRLIASQNPVPTILSESEQYIPKSVLPSMKHKNKSLLNASVTAANTKNYKMRIKSRVPLRLMSRC